MNNPPSISKFNRYIFSLVSQKLHCFAVFKSKLHRFRICRHNGRVELGKVRDYVIVSHSSRAIHDHKDVDVVNPICWQSDTGIESHKHIVHIRHCHVCDYRHFIPMPANIPLVSVPELACPAGLYIAELIASVPRDKIVVIAAIVLQIDPVSANFCACVCGCVICTPRARIAHFYLA